VKACPPLMNNGHIRLWLTLKYACYVNETCRDRDDTETFRKMPRDREIRDRDYTTLINWNTLQSSCINFRLQWHRVHVHSFANDEIK